MDYDNEEECGVNEPHVDCSNAFNTCHVFGTRDDVLQWARTDVHENGFVAVIMRLCGKPVHGGECWMVKLICGIHNHELAKSLVGHPHAGRLTKDEKKIIADMTKSMVKPKNILLMLKEHNANSCTTIKQIYNARSAYRSSIRGADTEMQHLMKLLERDPYIHWHRLKDEVVVRDLFWVESAHWALKRVLQNSLEDLCSVWDVMNNMITLQHVEIKASFETNTHVAGHVFKKTLYKRLVGMVSRNALNEIATEVERLRYLGNDPSSCGCVMRSTLGLPCACELSRYTVGSILVDSVHMFWRKLCFSDQGLCEVEVSIKEEIETISKRFEELDVCGKLTLKSKLRDIAYPDHNSMCPPPLKVNTKGAPKKPMKRSQRSTKHDPSY
ncbi:hypothetical protein HKD37_15G044049 [Glycine soja]